MGVDTSSFHLRMFRMLDATPTSPITDMRHRTLDILKQIFNILKRFCSWYDLELQMSLCGTHLLRGLGLLFS